MRGFSTILVAVLVSIGIGVAIESHTIASGPLPTIRSGVGSLTASPYLEASFTIAANGFSRAIERELPKTETVTVEVASADGRTALDALPSGGPVDLQLSVKGLPGTLADIRVVVDRSRPQIFARVFPSRLALLGPISPSARSELDRVGAFIDGLWFSVPPTMLPPSSVQRRPGAQVASAEAAFERDLLATTHLSSRPVAAGTESEGTIDVTSLVSIVERDLFPLLGNTIGGRLPLGRLGGAIRSASGSATVAIVTDGDGTMTAGSITVLDGGRVVHTSITIRHDVIAIGVPRNARPLPRSLFGGVVHPGRLTAAGGL